MRVSPQVDIVFKKLFGVEENKDLLISLVNSVVGPEDQVTEVTLLNPYNAKDFKTDKLSILDIKAVGNRGQRFNIEIQVNDEANYDKRALFYWAKLYTEQLQEASGYDQLSKAIGIHILNFTSIEQTEAYHNVFCIQEKVTGKHHFKDMELHTIELNKFLKEATPTLGEIASRVKNALDMWVAFLTRHDLLDVAHLPPSLNDPALKKALHVLDVMSLGKRERELYEGNLKWLRAEASALKKARGDSHQEGKEEGIQIGIEKGIEKGNLETALKLLQRGFEDAEIMDITGLSQEHIETVKKSEPSLP